MRRAGRKITLAEARGQGDTMVTVWCVTPRPPDAPTFSHGGPNVCDHSSDIGIDVLIARYGPDRRLDEIPAVCSKCGGREVNMRGWRLMTNLGRSVKLRPAKLRPSKRRR